MGQCSQSTVSAPLNRHSVHGWVPVFTIQGKGRQRVWLCVGEWFSDVNIWDVVAHGCGGVMGWGDICYGQQTQVRFIDGILIAQRYWNQILGPIVVPVIHNHRLMLQHDVAISEEEWNKCSTGHDQQPDQCEGDVLYCVTQMVVTRDTA